MPSRVRHLLLTAATVAVAAGLAAVTQTSAQAVTCNAKASLHDAGGALRGQAITLCRGGAPLPGEPTPIHVVDDSGVVQRLDPVTGEWRAVAGGTGTITYTCAGTATNTYRTVNTSAGKASTPLTTACG
ncbi:hypothetical protein [Saccharothrix xinjiangensis]|uniref:Ig-like domain-containing protein n=1 Tax=Saccharothrix xinjiangensis TaxID=204798 RepID=A0ABV9Y8V3_9PSEU